MIELNTDIESAIAEMCACDGTAPAPSFSLPQNLFHQAKAKDKNSRRGIKALIRPENAACIVANLPAGPGDRTHCVLRGDFVLCDMIPQVIAASGGECDHLRIATLGMSVANADTLACLVERGAVRKLTVVVSHYFQQVDKTTTFRTVSERLAGKARLAVTRSHAKVILIPTLRDAYVFEGSANLRSSDNLEQMLVVNDRETHDFHAAWIDQLAE